MSKNKRSGRKQSPTVVSSENKQAVKTNRTAIIKITSIVGILLMATICFAAIGRWTGNTNAIKSSVPVQPLSTPQYAANAPAKQYVYAGSKLIAVSEPENPPPADLAVWRPSNGTWYVIGSQGSQETTQGWGLSGDIPVPGDYDGDGKTDFSVFRKDDPSAGLATWYILQSSDGSSSVAGWGLNDDIPAPADYDGDGKTDRAVFRNGTPYTGWYIVNSSTGSSSDILWGVTDDKPAPADYDGDGKADLCVWRTSNTNFYPILSGDSSTPTIDFSDSGTYRVSADYDGDGKADYALFDDSATQAKWYIRSSITGSMLTTVEWGIAGDKPVHNDYDADGKCDIATWRNSNGNWYIRQSTLIGQSGELRQVWWGLTGDTPVPAYYRR